MLTIHIRINDEAGKPVAVRLCVTDGQGTSYAPFGRMGEFPLGRNESVGGSLRLGKESWHYIAGECEIRLPPSVPLRVRITKGPEFLPIDQEVQLGAGQMALRYTISRKLDCRADGWRSGDFRTHALSPHAALLEADAEGLDLIELAARTIPVAHHDGHTYLVQQNIDAFSGQEPALKGSHAEVYVNSHNTHPVLGTVGLVNCHRAVFPFTFGGEDSDDWSIAAWSRQCRRKGGIAIWTNPFDTDHGAGFGEAFVSLVLGGIDAIEYSAQPRKLPFIPWYYRLLNCGFRLPLVGSSAKETNTIPVGLIRTRAPLKPGTPFTYKKWIEAIKLGRSYVTNGPELSFEIEGRSSGSVLTLPASGSCEVIARAAGLQKFANAELIVNGEVIGSISPQEHDGVFIAEMAIAVPVLHSSWAAFRCIGADGYVAHTSPIYLEIPNAPFRIREEALRLFRQSVEKTRDWIEHQGRFEIPKRKADLLECCTEALAKLDAKKL